MPASCDDRPAQCTLSILWTTYELPVLRRISVSGGNDIVATGDQEHGVPRRY
jgi:hypothetical protein